MWLNPERKAIKCFRRKYKKSVLFVIVCGLTCFAKLTLEQKFNVLRFEASKKLIGGEKIKKKIFQKIILTNIYLSGWT